MAALRACLRRLPYRTAQALDLAPAAARQVSGVRARRMVTCVACTGEDGPSPHGCATPVPDACVGGTRPGSGGSSCTPRAAGRAAYGSALLRPGASVGAWRATALPAPPSALHAVHCSRGLHTAAAPCAKRNARRKTGSEATVKQALALADKLRGGGAAAALAEGGEARRGVVARVVQLKKPLFRAQRFGVVMELLDAIQPPGEPIEGLGNRLRALLEGGGVGLDTISLARALGFDDAWMAIPPHVSAALAARDGSASVGESGGEGTAVEGVSDSEREALLSDDGSGSGGGDAAAAAAVAMVRRAFWGSSKLLSIYVFAVDGMVRSRKKGKRLFTAGPVRGNQRDASDALLMMRLGTAAGLVPNSTLGLATMRLAAATGNRAVALGVLGVQAQYSIPLVKDTAIEFMRTYLPRYTLNAEGVLRHQPSKQVVDLFLAVLAAHPRACERPALRLLVETCARCDGYRIDDALTFFRKFVPGVPDVRTRVWLAVGFLLTRDMEGVTAFWDDDLMSELPTPIEAVALFNAAAREPLTPAQVDLMDRVWRGALQFTMRNPRTQHLTSEGHVLLSRLIRARLGTVPPGSAVTPAQLGVEALAQYYPVPALNGPRDDEGRLQWPQGMPSSGLLSDVIDACLACKDVERLAQVFDYAQAGARILTPALVKAAQTLLVAQMPFEAATACDVYMRQAEAWRRAPTGVMIRLAAQAYGALGRVADVTKLVALVDPSKRAATPGLAALQMRVLCALVQAHATRGDVDAAMDVFEAAVDVATEAAELLIDPAATTRVGGDPAAFIAQRQLRPACEALVTALARSGDTHATLDLVEDAAHNMGYAPTPRAFRLMVDMCRSDPVLMERVLALMHQAHFEPRGWVLSTMRATLGPPLHTAIGEAVERARAFWAQRREQARRGGRASEGGDSSDYDSDMDSGTDLFQDDSSVGDTDTDTYYTDADTGADTDADTGADTAVTSVQASRRA